MINMLFCTAQSNVNPKFYKLYNYLQNVNVVLRGFTFSSFEANIICSMHVKKKNNNNLMKKFGWMDRWMGHLTNNNQVFHRDVKCHNQLVNFPNLTHFQK